MDFSGIASWVAYSIIGLLTVVVLFRLGIAAMRGKAKECKDEIKQYLMICFFFGILPGLGGIAIDTGKSLVKPVTSIVEAVSEKVSDEAVKSVQGN